ncbi:response regulator [Flavobacterium lacustre]|jgi:CheY-like chemotaxis protein|uniref:response regulator n=1 Tax=Flavobacterium lacustre TaxID=3016339 RepID=UPI0022B5EE5D|nr:response regulator [Flavobacterium lacustre]MDO9183327.1 response regulator [Bacteriovorax sp.]
MKKKEIWIVDDDNIYQIIVRKIISKIELFSSFSSYKNGKDAIDALKKAIENNENIPDVILLDINMPIMDGWEFMDEIVSYKSKLKQKIAIYIVSSSIAVQDKDKAKTYTEILGFLSKPITMDALYEIVSEI